MNGSRCIPLVLSQKQWHGTLSLSLPSLSPFLRFSHRHPLPRNSAIPLAINVFLARWTRREGRGRRARAVMGRERGNEEANSLDREFFPTQLLLPSSSPFYPSLASAHPSSIYPPIHRPPSIRFPLLFFDIARKQDRRRHFDLLLKILLKILELQRTILSLRSHSHIP